MFMVYLKSCAMEFAEHSTLKLSVNFYCLIKYIVYIYNCGKREKIKLIDSIIYILKIAENIRRCTNVII